MLKCNQCLCAALLSCKFLEWQQCHSDAEGFGFHPNYHTIEMKAWLYIWQFSIFLFVNKKFHLYKYGQAVMVIVYFFPMIWNQNIFKNQLSGKGGHNGQKITPLAKHLCPTHAPTNALAHALTHAWPMHWPMHCPACPLIQAPI